VNWLRHAFALDAGQSSDPSQPERAVVEAVCIEIVRRRLSTPALLMLEMSRPLNYVSAQLLTFFQPFLALVGDTGAYDHFTRFLERRGSVDYIVTRIEALESAGRPASDGVRGTRSDSCDGPR
jgi:hypothetical protein